jgi:hypothetical protein
MRVSKRPWIIGLLGVVPKGVDKLRLILDLRYINSFLRIDSFKYEFLKTIPHLCKLKDLLFSVDMKSSYHHVDIHQDYWKFLGSNGKANITCSVNSPLV